ncbi:MAG: MMPL family transporter, partial [Gammaproteobacteria bacterium]|nr:MMPL family transporter [Gammaproteobacteria bacterium]
MFERGRFDLGDYTGWYVAMVVRWPLLTLAMMVALTWVCGRYAVEHLKMDTDTTNLISGDLQWRKDFTELRQRFPEYSDTLIVRIEARDGPSARAAAVRMATLLREQSERIQSVFTPAAEPFLQRNALLYLPLHELEVRTDALLRAQPALARLHRDPTLAEVARLLEAALDARKTDPVAAVQQRPAELDSGDTTNGFGAQGLPEAVLGQLDALARAIAVVMQSESARMDWTAIGSSEVTEQAATGAGRTQDPYDPARTLLVVKPVLDSSRLLPAGPAIELVRGLRERMEREDPTLRIRITGGLLMEHDETATVAQDARDGVLWVLAVVMLVLLIGLRSWRLVMASLLTLLVGLVCTAAFAAFAVGRINLVSVVFAVLYVGLAIDYAIHFSLWFRELRATGADTVAALVATGRDVGMSLSLCALTSGLGFLAFVPTDYEGVSELGIIAGAGMFIGLLVTMTMLPAVLRILPTGHGVRRLAGNGAFTGMLRLPIRRPQLVLTLTCVAAAGASLLISRAQFDDDPINLRVSDSEAVQTYREMIAEGSESPWRLSVIAHSREQMEALSDRLQALPEVEEVFNADSLVPNRQPEKLELIDSLAVSYSAVLDAPQQRSTLAEATRLLWSLARRIDAEPLPGPGFSSLGAAIEQVIPEQGAVDPALQARVIGNLELIIAEIGRAIEASAFSLDQVPDELRMPWVKDQAFRIDIVPDKDLNDRDHLLAYVDAVRGVAANATGLPVVQLEAGRVVLRAFQQALLLAVLAVALSRREYNIMLASFAVAFAMIWLGSLRRRMRSRETGMLRAVAAAAMLVMPLVLHAQEAVSPVEAAFARVVDAPDAAQRAEAR